MGTSFSVPRRGRVAAAGVEDQMRLRRGRPASAVRRRPLRGGMGGTYIRTIGQTGTASLTVAAPQCDPVTVTFSVTGKENTVWN